MKAKIRGPAKLINFLRGTLVEARNGMVTVEVNGIGYGVYVPSSLTGRLPSSGQEVRLFTCLIVQENNLSLFGFFASAELELFRRLLNVDGIGPKGALKVLSAFDPEALRLAIIKEDVNVLSSAPGIGKKTARRMILELKDVLIAKGEEIDLTQIQDFDGEEKDALAALIALGFDAAAAKKALWRIPAKEKDNLKAGEMVKQALQWIGRQK
ncbi:MAG TPA: Holliday junction branch migration protein RuvA [Desulfotomaculum sp.]|nr:Holliday junction branch migration protein RuvA [Desulfotomaculum sp.]HCJ79703.1 Holliday junction branch migration protein RuvA [Desulfotomaculum sp.]